jgi:hypothetical protein
LSRGGFVRILGHLLLLECGSPKAELRHRSLSELVAGGPLISFHPRRCGLASAEMPRNRLSKGNDLIEGAMI